MAKKKAVKRSTKKSSKAVSHKSAKPHFLDMHLFGLKLKPWHGIAIGLPIVILFGGIIGLFGGIFIIASLLAMVKHLLFGSKKTSKRK